MVFVVRFRHCCIEEFGVWPSALSPAVYQSNTKLYFHPTEVSAYHLEHVQVSMRALYCILCIACCSVLISCRPHVSGTLFVQTGTPTPSIKLHSMDKLRSHRRRQYNFHQTPIKHHPFPGPSDVWLRPDWYHVLSQLLVCPLVPQTQYPLKPEAWAPAAWIASERPPQYARGRSPANSRWPLCWPRSPSRNPTHPAGLRIPRRARF